jgi:hypothetical protein
LGGLGVRRKRIALPLCEIAFLFIMLGGKKRGLSLSANRRIGFILFGLQLKSKASLPHSGSLGLFVSVPPESKLSSGHQQKASVHLHRGFSLVDKRFEISNLDLIRDIRSIINLEEFLFLSLID